MEKVLVNAADITHVQPLSKNYMWYYFVCIDSAFILIFVWRLTEFVLILLQGIGADA